MGLPKTPPLYAKGTYSLTSPYTLPSSQSYTCVAIRSFRDLLKLHIDVVKAYYTPVGLGEAEYKNDTDVAAAIITLLGDDGQVVYVPDTYISSYPGLSGYDYKHMVLSVSLGTVWDQLPLDDVKEKIAETVKTALGVEATVYDHVAPSTNSVTQTEHERIETARRAAIRNQKTLTAQILELKASYAALQEQYTALETLAMEKGIIGVVNG